jgi:hypothetical protein
MWIEVEVEVQSGQLILLMCKESKYRQGYLTSTMTQHGKLVENLLAVTKVTNLLTQGSKHLKQFLKS